MAAPDHHHHHHHEALQTDSTMSFTEQNRAHWDKFAGQYTAEQWQKDMINKVTEFVLANVSWLGVDFIDTSSKFEISDQPVRQVRVLDYACGPGTMTNALQSHATEFVGIDLSQNMVQAYNTRFSPITEQADAETINANAVVGNLLDENDPSPSSLSDDKFFNFDLIIIGLGFHHFENLEEATKRMTARLKSGGVFAILDFLPHGPIENHPAGHTVAHLGFGEEKVKELFSGAGLVDVGIFKMDGEILMRGLSPRQPFLGKGRKP